MRFKGQILEFDRLINARRRPFGRLGCFIGLLWGGLKKRRCPSAGRGGGRALLNVRTFSWAILPRKIEVFTIPEKAAAFFEKAAPVSH
jgi:hypothetical protein